MVRHLQSFARYPMTRGLLECLTPMSSLILCKKGCLAERICNSYWSFNLALFNITHAFRYFPIILGIHTLVLLGVVYFMIKSRLCQMETHEHVLSGLGLYTHTHKGPYLMFNFGSSKHLGRLCSTCKHTHTFSACLECTHAYFAPFYITSWVPLLHTGPIRGLARACAYEGLSVTHEIWLDYTHSGNSPFTYSLGGVVS